MAISTIPIIEAGTEGGFFFVVSLDGQEFKLQFLYNDREGFWYLDIFDANDVPVRQGLKVVVNWPLLKRCSELSRPAGELLVVDARAETEDPTLDNLGVENSLTYVDGADVP